jgi:hypothetical protein
MPQNPLVPQYLNNVLTGKGNKSALNVSAATVIKAAPGRICKVNVTTAGSTNGTISDVLTTGAVAAANLVISIPDTVGSYDVDFPCLVGIVFTPGTGMVASISYV